MPSRIFHQAFCLGALALIAPLKGQAPADGRHVSRKAVLIELFTSEGCSSCPPADQMLRAINGQQTADGQLLVGLSEHVTYWNRLGWQDRFSDDVFTARQNAYAEHLHLNEVYTPQMVINGREQIVGGDRAALASALHREASAEAVDLSIATLRQENHALLFHLRVGQASRWPLEIVAVVTDDMDRSEVTRGENAGSMLQHVAVARLLVPVATIEAAGEKEVRLGLPPRVFGTAGQSHHLVILAQDPATGAILGTATQPLL